MRLVLVVTALLSSTTLGAQSRWTLSAGPEWYAVNHIGGRLRGDYDLIRPDWPVRLRLELGGYWEPTQSWSGTMLDGTRFGGSIQSLDLSFGLSAALTPLPRARLAPYATIGVLARQMWVTGLTSYMPPGGPMRVSSANRTAGHLIVPVGVGLRARIAGRMFQVELRRLEARNSMMVGSSLPF